MGNCRDAAIIGMACQLPGDVDSPESFWEFVSNSRCSTRPIPQSRFNASQFYHPDRTKKGHFHVQGGSFLEQDPSVFDAPFFNIGEAEAKALDPQQRLLLQTTFLAIENAGIKLEWLSGRHDVGVFAAGPHSEYHDRFNQDRYTASAYAGLGTGVTMHANRISYFLNLKGPSLTIDTACSSALSALHLAVESIKRGECTCAIVGGSTLQLSPHIISAYASLGTVSKDGISFSFDSRANGYGRGEGSVCIVLRSLEHAIISNDSVRALIRGTSVNHVGRSQGISLPDGKAQADLIASVYKNAHLDPHDTLFVEAHGTGTERGDPIEAESIATGLKAKDRGAENPLYIGSVKSNFGHLEAVSGLVSVIKCVMMLEKQTLLPTANFKEPNHAIDMGSLNIKVVTKSMPWSQPIRRASINNFGFGGSNAHVILEEGPGPKASSSGIRLGSEGLAQLRIFTFSAKEEESLKDYLKQMRQWLAMIPDDQLSLQDLSYTLCCRRSRFPYSFATTASTKTQLLQRLEGIAKPVRMSRLIKPVFIFTGQGAQWPRMGAELMKIPVFERTMKDVNEILRGLDCEWSLIDEVLKPAETSNISSASISQPAVTALQISLIHLLRSWGVNPEAVCGHSSGEIAASYSAGLLDMHACMAIAYYRGKAAAEILEWNRDGAMMAIGADPAFIEPYLWTLQRGHATIACYNSPQSVTVSGDRAALEELSAKLDKSGTFYRMLHVDVAYHSDHMVPVAEQYCQRIRPFLNNAPQSSSTCEFYSSVTGKIEESHAVRSPWYWVINLVSPVQFTYAVSSVVAKMGAERTLSFIEVGPHGALKGPLRDICVAHPSCPTYTYHSMVTRKEDSLACVTETAAALVNEGFELVLDSLLEDPKESSYNVMTNLPQYCFNQSRRYWHKSRILDENDHKGSPWHVLLGHKITGAASDHLEFRNIFTLDEIPWLRDHQVNGEVIFPAAGYISMAIEAVLCSHDHDTASAGGYRIREATFGKALRLSEDNQNELFTKILRRKHGSRTTDSSEWLSFSIHSWSEKDGLSEHCSGLIAWDSKTSKTNEVGSHSLHATLAAGARQLRRSIEEACHRKVSPQRLYSQLKRAGLSYGQAFARLSRLETGLECAFGEVVSTDTRPLMPFEYENPLKVHPTTFDAILHVSLCNLNGSMGDPTALRAIVPTFVEELYVDARFTEQAGQTLSVYGHDITTERLSRMSRCSLTCFLEDTDTPVLTIKGIKAFEVREEKELLSAIDSINPLHVRWHDHTAFIDSSYLENWHDPEVVVAEAEEEARLLKQQAYYLLKETISSNMLVLDSKSPLALMKTWIKTTIDGMESESSSEAQDWITLSESERRRLIDHVAETSCRGRLNARIGRELPSILAGRVDALSTLFQKDGLWKAYEECTLFSRSNRQLAQLVLQLSQQNPELRILEVGAGTGGLTSKLLHALCPSPEASARYEVYDYTDISAGFFENAREKFADYPSVNFKKLNVSKDPVEQGFVASDYDLIVAMDIIHATPNAQESLQHLRQLLKPGGTLAMVELNDFSLYMFPFATLPGWWHKPNGPVIMEDEWNEMLLASGYTGVDAAIQDFPNVGLHRVYWTHAKDSSGVLPATIQLVDEEKTESSQNLQAEVSILLEKVGIKVQRQSLDQCGQHCDHVILLDESGSLLLDELDDSRFRALRSLISKAKSLLWITRSSSPKARFVTGFVRTVQRENPGMTISALHLDEERQSHSAQSVVRLWNSVHGGPSYSSADVEFREVNGRIQIPRLEPADALHEFIEGDSRDSLKEDILMQENKNRTATIGTPGLFSTLHFEESSLNDRPIRDDEILIQIKAVGLNFKDVLIAMGILPWQGLGGEASGIVVKSGNLVESEFPVGSTVLHWATGVLATHSVGTADNTIRLPPGFTMEDAASIPIIYSTAYESLVTLGDLQRDDTVLIHAAAGGVGQAAIMIAQWIGAEIFCTVGSDAKKDLIMRLYGIPEDHIFSSRSSSFHQGILAMTAGAGADVVLNSLAGELLRLSWQCVADRGRFVDISKRDAVENASLDMAPFNRGVTYTALDLSLSPNTGHRGRKRMMDDVSRLFKTGAVRTVCPVSVVPMSGLETAFRTLQMGKHTGKIVLVNRPEDKVTVRETIAKASVISPGASYIITGGLGGLGQYLCQWLLAQGAKFIILAARSAHSPEHAGFLQRVSKKASRVGGKVLAVACDVGSMSSVNSMIAAAASAGMPPVKGVIHGAMVLKDAMLETTTLQNWQAVIGPKVQGAINLDQALDGSPLNFFICLTSIVGVLGNPGQSSYAGSNSFLDGFCQWRRDRGLPACSIALPGISDVGYVAELAATDPSAISRINLHGLSITGEQLGVLIKAVLGSRQNDANIVAGVSRTKEMTTNPLLQDTLVSQVRSGLARRFAQGGAPTDSRAQGVTSQSFVNRDMLSGAADVDSASKLVFQGLAHKIAKDMMIPCQDITTDSTLSTIGLDSLVAVEFRNWLARELSTDIRVMDIIGCNTIQDMVTLVVKRSALLAHINM